MKGIILYNPWSAKYGYRIPNSILQVAASLEGKFKCELVDGNREKDPLQKIYKMLESGEYDAFGCTVMPGPQLKQAIPFTKNIKKKFPDIHIIWGGYFASNQWKVVMDSGYVDIIVDGPAENAIAPLLERLNTEQTFEDIPNLIYRDSGILKQSRKEPIPDMTKIPDLPYVKLFEKYSPEGYLKKTFLGKKTAAYHSSFGCPFTCSFCAVVPIYNARWKGLPAERIISDLKYLKKEYGIDAVEFHDNNFFVSQERTAEVSKALLGMNIQWWGEGRIDTIDKYKDETLQLMRESGCRMIFFGAESGDDLVLAKMNKGGTQTAKQIAEFAARMKKFDIVPEYSFVLGTPASTEREVMDQIDRDITFIREIKRINPDTEIILYLYSPVATEGSELFKDVENQGFKFPEKLEDWLQDQWQHFDERKNPMTPWLKPAMVDKIRNFETVLNAQYPTISDFKISEVQRSVMKKLSSFRYKNSFYQYPYELKVLQKLWLNYRRPETEGMYME